jgi:N6-adenosine-specific RNA methylase IME4
MRARKTSKRAESANAHSVQRLVTRKLKYRTICADPPWDVKRGPTWNSGGTSRPLEYPTMTLDAIKALPVKELADDGCHLYLWTINKYVEAAYEVARSWGFEPSTLLVWAKAPHGFGLGGTYCLTTEYILFARRGTLAAKKRVDTTWWNWSRGRHSEKPEDFRELVEAVSPSPRLELFARRKPEIWHYWGNEIESDVDLPGNAKRSDASDAFAAAPGSGTGGNAQKPQ